MVGEQVADAVWYVVTGILVMIFCEFTTPFCGDLVFALR